MPSIRRKFSGPNGSRNFIPDNGIIELSRDIDGRIIEIQITGPTGIVYTRAITRDLSGAITLVDFWVEV